MRRKPWCKANPLGERPHPRPSPLSPLTGVVWRTQQQTRNASMQSAFSRSTRFKRPIPDIRDCRSGAAAMAYALWANHLRFNPADPHWFNRDRFVLSAGHGSALLYALLHLYGYDLSLDDLKSFRQLGSKTPGHPEYHHTPGVEVTTGPARPRLRQRRRHGDRRSALGATYNNGEDDRRPLHVRAGRRRRPDGRRVVRSRFARRAPQARQADRLYDDNKISLAGNDRDHVHRRRAAALRGRTAGTRSSSATEFANDVATIDNAIAAAKAVTDKPSLILVRSIIGYRFAQGQHVRRARRAARCRERQEDERGPGLADSSRRSSSRRRRGYSRPKPKARREAAGRRGTRSMRAGKRANAELAAQFERARDGKLPDDHRRGRRSSRKRQRRDARCGRHGDERDRQGSLPELVGGSADLDPSTKTYLKGFGDFQPEYVRRPQHPLRRARTRDGCGDERHRAARRAAAVRSDLLQLRRLPASRRCAWRRSTRSARSTSSPTTRCSWAKTARRISRSSSSRCCARRRTAQWCARPTRSKRSKPGSSRSSRAPARGRSCSRARNCRSWAYANAAVDKGGYILVDSGRHARPDSDRDGFGSCARGRRRETARRQRARKTRVVSMPVAGQLFDGQDASVSRQRAAARRSRLAFRSKPARRSAGRITSAIAASPSASITSERRPRRPRSPKNYGFTPENIADVAAGLLSSV